MDGVVGGDGDAGSASEIAAVVKTNSKLTAAGTESPEQVSLICPTCSQVGLSVYITSGSACIRLGTVLRWCLVQMTKQLIRSLKWHTGYS